MSIQQMSAYARRAAVGVSEDYLGALFTWLAEGEQTGGAYSLVDALIRQGLEPPPHTHTHEDEAYMVLDGRIRFVVDDLDHVAEPGELTFLPRGRQHAFFLESATARALIILSPAGLESAFHELSTPAFAVELPPQPDLAPRIPAILAVMGQHGIHFPPPPS